MKPAKRFYSAQQIINAIEACHTKAATWFAEAELLEQVYLKLIRIPKRREEAVEKKEEAKKLRKRAARLLEKRAPALGRKLAEFRTGLIPFRGNDDTSVKAL